MFLCVCVSGGRGYKPVNIVIYLNQLSLDQSKFLHSLFMAVTSPGLVEERRNFLSRSC